MKTTADVITKDRILRTPEVCRITGLCRVTLWRWERAGHFPARVNLGPGRSAIGWRESDVLGWIASRPRVTVRGDAVAA